MNDVPPVFSCCFIPFFGLLTVIFLLIELGNNGRAYFEIDRDSNPKNLANKNAVMRFNGPMVIGLCFFMTTVMVLELLEHPDQLFDWLGLAFSISWLWLSVRWTKRAWERDDK
jgi:hypothetical protein